MGHFQQLSKNILFATLSILLVLGIFAVGFYTGTESKSGNSQSRVSALTPADLGPFWKVWSLIEDRYVAASSTKVISDEERIFGAIGGMVDSLGDPYTTFFTPEDNANFKESIQGNFQGVGMEVGKRDGLLTVITPLKDTPAYNAGIKAADIILQIDGKSTADMTVDAAVQNIRGEAGTIVEITIAREGDNEPRVFKVTRDNIRIPTIDYKLRDDGIFVISLFNFSAGVEDDFRKALREFVLARSNKLVLDLRGNPGGFLAAAVDISSWFLPTGKVIVREDFGADREEKLFRSKGYNIFNSNLKMVILINKGSASASEIVAGALKEHGIATLVGEHSFGKGSVQELIGITEETSLKVTIARWLTPNGNLISDGGLKPDIEVKITDEDVEAEIDTQLNAAIELLLK